MNALTHCVTPVGDKIGKERMFNTFSISEYGGVPYHLEQLKEINIYSKNGHLSQAQFSAEMNSIYLSVACRMESGSRVMALYGVVDLANILCSIEWMLFTNQTALMFFFE